jgi:hypothetical protein
MQPFVQLKINEWVEVVVRIPDKPSDTLLRAQDYRQ